MHPWWLLQQPDNKRFCQCSVRCALQWEILRFWVCFHFGSRLPQPCEKVIRSEFWNTFERKVWDRNALDPTKRAQQEVQVENWTSWVFQILMVVYCIGLSLETLPHWAANIDSHSWFLEHLSVELPHLISREHWSCILHVIPHEVSKTRSKRKGLLIVQNYCLLSFKQDQTKHVRSSSTHRVLIEVQWARACQPLSHHSCQHKHDLPRGEVGPGPNLKGNWADWIQSRKVTIWQNATNFQHVDTRVSDVSNV